MGFFFFFRFLFRFFVGVKGGAFDERFGGLVVGEKVGAVGESQTASAPTPIQRPHVVVAVASSRSFRSCGMHAVIICRHPSRSWAAVTISVRVRWQGTSMNRLPSVPISYCRIATRYSRRSGPIRRICPSHRALVRLMAATRSKVRVRTLASSCMVRPVILLRQREFAPLSAARVLSLMFHASLP